MDTEQALLTAIHQRITQDEVLKPLILNEDGTTRLKLLWAKKNEKFPYIVHSLDSRNLDPRVLREGTYYLDLWDYGQTATRIHEMRGQVIGILDESLIGLIDPNNSFLSVSQPQNGEPRPILVAARLKLTTSGMIPEDTEGIWHLALQFSMRYTRSIQEIERLTK